MRSLAGKVHIKDLPQGTDDRSVRRWLEQTGEFCTPVCHFGSLTDVHVTTPARSRAAQAFLTFHSANDAALAFSIAWQWYAEGDTGMMCGVSFMRNTGQ